MKIRKAKNSDLNALAEIYAEVFKTSVFKEKWKINDAIVFVKFLKKRKPSLFHVAEENGIVIGGISSVVKPWMGIVGLADSELFVKKEYQKKSVAKKLITKHLKVASEKYGATEHWAMTTAKETFPLTWYERIGYKRNNEYAFIDGKISEILKKINI